MIDDFGGQNTITYSWDAKLKDIQIVFIILFMQIRYSVLTRYRYNFKIKQLKKLSIRYFAFVAILILLVSVTFF